LPAIGRTGIIHRMSDDVCIRYSSRDRDRTLQLAASAAESPNVVKEVSLALDRKKHILPVNLEPVEVPVALRDPLATAGRVQRKTLNDKVIAVLPFVNISPDKESDYFGDGLTEDLISNLSRMKGMSAVSRTNSINYTGSKLDIQETVSKEIVDALELKLTPVEKVAPPSNRTVDA
jgi:hypothetical protein